MKNAFEYHRERPKEKIPKPETEREIKAAQNAAPAAQTFKSAHRLGDLVNLGGTIRARIEEIIFGRNVAAPYYLVEYWHEGHLISHRIHEEDCK